MKKKIYIIILGFLVLIPFQNCGNQFLIDPELRGETTLFSKSCDAELRNVFQHSFYPFLRAHCAACHFDGGSGFGFFADPNASRAWESFMSTTPQTIERRAISDHQSGFTGPQHTVLIESFKAQRLKAENTQELCRQNQGGGGNPLKLPVQTIEKTTTIPMANAWVTLTWNLQMDTVRLDQRNLIPAEVSIEVRHFKPTNLASAISGYEFRNPKIRLLKDGNIKFNGLYITINNKVRDDLTMFSSLSNNVSTSEFTSFFSGSTASYLTSVDPLDTLGLHFNLVELNSQGTGSGGGGGDVIDNPLLPQTVTLAQLLGNDPALNVFAASCVSCHRPGNALGSLDITTEARQQSDIILSRMKNLNNPMPRSGLLPDNRIRLVEIWINSGRP